MSSRGTELAGPQHNTYPPWSPARGPPETILAEGVLQQAGAVRLRRPLSLAVRRTRRPRCPARDRLDRWSSSAIPRRQPRTRGSMA
jgi:hypothetical protein